MHWVTVADCVAIKFTENLSRMLLAQSLDKPLAGGKSINEKALVARRIPRANRMPNPLFSSSFDFRPAS